MKPLTKAQAIKRLAQLGWTDFTPQGRHCVWATSPKGQRGLYYPLYLLAELALETRTRGEMTLHVNPLSPK